MIVDADADANDDDMVYSIHSVDGIHIASFFIIVSAYKIPVSSFLLHTFTLTLFLASSRNIYNL